MKFRFAILLTALAILLSACSLSLADDITPPPDYKTPTPAPTVGPIFPANSPDLASGAVIYAEKCAPCHGATGLADGPMVAQLPKPAPAFGKPEVARAGIPANWFTAVTQGKIDALMPPFNSLSEQQRWDVVAYAMSLGTSAAEIEQGKAVYETSCARCHGADGKLAAKANLADQGIMAKLNQNDLVNFINQGVGEMPGLGGQLDETQMFAAAAYVRAFTFVPALAEEPASAPAASSSQATPTPAAASAEATPVQAAIGTISGLVTNASGGSLSSGLTAVLHVFDHDIATQQFAEAEPVEAPVSADGKYVFENVSLAETRAYYVSVDYLGMTYESAPAIPAQDGKSEYDLPIAVYDTTADTSTLKITQAHILLDYSKTDVIQVIEFYIISNTGNKTIAAAEEGGPVVKISLPDGYSNLQFENGEIGGRYLQTPDGFADTLSIPSNLAAEQQPNQQQYSLVFAFDMPMPKDSALAGIFGGPKFEFSQKFTLAADAVSILLPEGLKVEGDNFTDGGLQDMGTGNKFQLYDAGSRKVGDILSMTVSGKPARSAATPVTTSSDSTRNIVIGVGVFGVVLILVGVWLYWRDRNAAGEDDDLAEDDDEGEKAEDIGNADEIMDAIITLDDQYKSGNLAEDAYKQRRAELKAKLKGNL